MLSHGADMTGDENPFELGLGRLVDLDQDADFVGKQALREASAQRLTRRLCGLEIEGEPLHGNEDWWTVSHQGAAIGTVRSAAHSPRLKKNIALAMLNIDFTAPGACVEVTTPAGEQTGIVAQLPFCDPQKNLVRGRA